MSTARIMLLLAVISVLVSCGSTAAPRSRPAPTGRYPVPTPVGSIVNDAAAFATFAAAVRPDVERDTGTVTAPETLQSRWFVIALLDALAGDYPASLAALDRVAALEKTAAQKAMVGLTIRVHADAGPDATPEAFRRALDARIATLPVAELGKELSTLRTLGQILSPAVCQKLVDDAIGPHVKAGTVDIEQAQALAFQRYAVVKLVPYGKIIDEVLAARGIAPLRE
jgi:hypothetical protein